jgi:aspartyl-tRNA(Asn)/glutamyl-tRNA(Gln) amidotransferase subunit C
MSEKSKIIDVDYVANLARIDIDKEKKEMFQKDMENIVNYVNQLAELDVEGVVPTAHAIEMNNVLREDEASDSVSRDIMLKNSPESINEELIKVPQVIPGEGTA